MAVLVYMFEAQALAVSCREAAAADVTFAIWQRMVLELAALWDQDGGYDPAADLTRSQLHLRPVGDITAVSGELVGESALTISWPWPRSAAARKAPHPARLLVST